MRIREVQKRDRDEWLRLLLGLYAGSHDSDHVPLVDAFLNGGSSECLLPSIFARRFGKQANSQW